MSKREPKYDSLPKHQRKIVLWLAQAGPTIIRETNTKIKGEYTSTNRAFHELEAKGLIKRVSVMEYRKREFPKFWLTDGGLALAIIYKANIELLREYAQKLYGKQMKYNFLFDMAKALPPDKLGELLTMFKTTEEGNPKLKAIPITNAEREAVFKVLMKYPEIRKTIKEKLRNFMEIL